MAQCAVGPDQNEKGTYMKGIHLTAVQPYNQRSMAQRSGKSPRAHPTENQRPPKSNRLGDENCLYQERPEKTDQKFTVIAWSEKEE